MKGTVLNFQGEIVLRSSVNLPPVKISGNAAQFDPNEWWVGFKAIIAKMRRELDIGTLRSICVGGQGPSLVAVDRTGTPLYDSLIWMDRRASEEAAVLSAATKTTVDPYLIVPKIMWLKNHEPSVYERTYKFLAAYDFISYRLTGLPTSGVLRRGYTPWWSIPYWSHDHARAAQVDTEKLPDTALVGEPIGQVTRNASTETGLAEGTTVVQGVTDFAHDILGAGVVDSGVALDRGGTSQGFDLCWSESLRDSENRILTTEHIIPDRWNISGLMSTTGAVLRWFRDNFCIEELNEAKRSRLDIYTILADKASKAPVGSSGLVILPYFAGERSPIWDPSARGVIYGLTLSHTKNHLIRAIMESVAYSLRNVKELIGGLGGKVTEVRSVGGQSRSPLWNQIKADVLGVPVVSLRQESTESLGAAMIAGCGIKVFKSFIDASNRIVRVKQRFEPNQPNLGQYSSSYAIYKKLYPTLRELYRELEDDSNPIRTSDTVVIPKVLASSWKGPAEKS